MNNYNKESEKPLSYFNLLYALFFYCFMVKYGQNIKE